MSSPGRNEPCPCGSGRKFKHCCLRALGAEDATRLQLRQMEGLLVPALFRYALDEFGREFLLEAWEEFFLWADTPSDLPSSREFGTTFEPFLLFSFVADPESEDRLDHWPGEPIALHFLHRVVENCPDDHRAFIEQACKSHPSFFVVESATPGRSINLKDVLTGRHFYVLEQSASRTFVTGDLTFTRVVTIGDGSIMIGASAWIIPASWHVPLIEFRDELAGGRKLTRADLGEFDFEIRELYLEIVERLQNPRPPELRNTDGDLFEATTLSYQVSVSPAEALELLRPLATLRGEAHVDDESFDAAGALAAATLTWIKAGNKQHRDWDNTTLGTLRLEDRTLTVEVNSRKRGDKIKREIKKRLGSHAVLTETKVTDIHEELAKRSMKAQPPVAELEQTPEIQALEAELLAKSWDAWVDAKIPALGNRTPRQAAKTERGRERLEALLVEFEHHGRGALAQKPDVERLRRLLGLAVRT